MKYSHEGQQGSAPSLELELCKRRRRRRRGWMQGPMAKHKEQQTNKNNQDDMQSRQVQQEPKPRRQ
jgi:hypothetical protein